MARRGPMLVWGFALTAGLLGGACTDLSDELENEPCLVPADCWHTQECARTKLEASLSLPGRCLPEGSGCSVGAQLGCVCNPADASMACYSNLLPLALGMTYPAMACDESLMVCVVAPPPENN